MEGAASKNEQPFLFFRIPGNPAIKPRLSLATYPGLPGCSM